MCERGLVEDRHLCVCLADTPTSSTLTCNQTIMTVSSTMVCSIVPVKGGVAIYSRASFFTPAGSSGSFGGVTPTAWNLLTFTYTAAATTSVADVTDGRFSAWSVIVTGVVVWLCGL